MAKKKHEIKEKEVKNQKTKNKKTLKLTNKQKTIVISIIGVLIIVLPILIVTSKEGSTNVKIKSTLEKVVEKSNLETATFTYNVIAKECKNGKKCDKKSNNIDDFEYVVSCKGKVTAGIDFDNVKITKDEKNKKYIVTIPEAKIDEENINVVSLKFINGEELSADTTPKANKLCAETIEEKAKKDDELLPKAKEQAIVTLQSFYEQWIKALEKDYTIEVK